MRELIRSLTPDLILRIYRPLRNRNRLTFRRLFDYRNSNRLKRQIIQRFPEFTSQSGKGVVLDIGANVGDFTHACLDLGFSVVAVEPHPNALVYLRKRMGKNHNVEILPVGVSDAAGKKTLYTHPDHLFDPVATSISASIISEKFHTKENSFEINVVTLDNLFESNMEFQIVKIDIEGAEMFLIDSIIRNSSKIKNLLIEKHERFMSNTREGDEYHIAMAKIEEFIKSNKLERNWFTDWI
jgi:FkbM family methyltransferase